MPHFGGICLGRNRWVSCIFVFCIFVVLGYIYRNCTEKGWSDFYPSYEEACKIPEDEEIEPEVNIAHSHLEIQDYLLDFLLLILREFIVIKILKFFFNDLSTLHIFQLQPCRRPSGSVNIVIYLLWFVCFHYFSLLCSFQRWQKCRYSLLTYRYYKNTMVNV